MANTPMSLIPAAARLRRDVPGAAGAARVDPVDILGLANLILQVATGGVVYISFLLLFFRSTVFRYVNFSVEPEEGQKTGCGSAGVS